MDSFLILAVLVFLFLSPVVAPQGEKLSEAMVWLFRLVAAPAIVLGRGAMQSAHAFRPVVAGAIRAQGYLGSNGERSTALWLWDQLGAIVGVACLGIFGALDWQVLSVTIESIMDLPGGSLPPVGKLLGLALVVAGAYTAFELANITGLTPIKRPWIYCTARWRRTLASLAAGCLLATIIAGIALAAYRQLQIQANSAATAQTIADPSHVHLPVLPEPLTAILLFTFVILMWGVLGVASAGSGLHVLPLLGGCTVLIKLLGLGGLYLIFAVCFLVVFIIACLCVAAVTVLHVLLGTWVMVWNWGCTFPRAERWHFSAIDPFPHPPFLANELAQELFPASLHPYAPPRRSGSTEKEISVMSRAPARVVTAIGGGRFAITALDSLRDAAERLGASIHILGMGYIATTQPAGHRVRTASGGILNLTPTIEDGQNSIELDPESQVHAQGHALVARAIQEQLDAKLAFGQTLWFGSLDSSMPLAEELLEEIAVRQPGQTILGVTSILTPDRHTERLQVGLESYLALHEAGIVTATLCTDERSRLARGISPEAQQEFVSTLLASMIRSPRDWERNHSMTDVARAMGREAETGLVGIAVASESIAAGKQVRVYGAIRRLVRRLPARGKGDLEDIIRRGDRAVRRAITDPACGAIDEQIDTNRPFYVVFTVPLHATDSRWVSFIKATSASLAQDFPNAVPIYASGQGTPDPRVPGSYWIQASVLFALPAMPAPLQTIADRRDLRAPTETVSNHNGHAEAVSPELITNAPRISGD